MAIDIEDIKKIQRVLAYTENIRDILDSLEHKKLRGQFDHIYNSVRNFNNRMNNKKSSKFDSLIDSLFSDEKSGEEFNRYRIEIDETISFILNLDSQDYSKLKAFREFNFEKDYVVASKKELKELVLDAKLNPNNAKKILDKWLKNN